MAHSEREFLIKSIDVANNELREGMMKELEKKIQQCREHNIKSEIKVEIGDAAQIIFNTIDKEHVDHSSINDFKLTSKKHCYLV